MCYVLCLGVIAGLHNRTACRGVFPSVPWQPSLPIQFLLLQLCGCGVVTWGCAWGFWVASHSHRDPSPHQDLETVLGTLGPSKTHLWHGSCHTPCITRTVSRLGKLYRPAELLALSALDLANISLLDGASPGSLLHPEPP